MTDVRREGEPVKVVLRYEGDGTSPKAAPPSGGDAAGGSVRDDLMKEARKRGVDVPERARRKESAAPKQDAGTRQVPAEVKAVWKFTVAFKMK
jgi:hypothetical protein